MHSLEVLVHGGEGVTGVFTALHCAVIHRALVVDLSVLLEIPLVLKAGRVERRVGE